MSSVSFRKHRVFKETDSVIFYDITVEESNASDLVVHEGAAVSPPDDFVGAKQFYIHSFQDDYNRVVSGEIDPQKVGTLSVYDINPDNWKELLNIKSKRDKIKYELKPEAMTNLFKCRSCGSRETSYYEVQTRSADEPMTQFITCLKCDNNWKQ